VPIGGPVETFDVWKNENCWWPFWRCKGCNWMSWRPGTERLFKVRERLSMVAQPKIHLLHALQDGFRPYASC
jgi:hypothetical protein